MRAEAGRKGGYLFIGLMGLSLSVLAPTGVAASEDAARAMAERFAAEPKTATPKAARKTERRLANDGSRASAEEQRLLEEIDMLERARAEAEARREAMEKAATGREPPEDAGAAAERRRQAEEARRIAEERRQAEEARRIAEERRQAEEVRRIAEERRKAEEARRIAEERRQAEEARRIAEERRQAEEARRIAEERRQAEEARRIAEERRQAEEARRIAEERRQADEARRIAEIERAEEARLAGLRAEREAEAARISEELRRAREGRGAERDVAGREETFGRRSGDTRTADEDGGDARPTTRIFRPEPTQPGEDADQGRVARSLGGDALRKSTRVTVLLQLQPGNYGIRRRNKTADPLLCNELGCYVSNGDARAARFLHRRRALGIGRTLGSRAGACRNSLVCVFRGIDLVTYPARLQPVDMHVLRHDRRVPMPLQHTSSCDLDGRGQLRCSGAFMGPDYVMWVVPEELAEAAGAAALREALDAGLPEPPGATEAAFRALQ